MLNGCYGYSVVAKHISEGFKEAGHNVWVLGTVTAGNCIKDDVGTPNIPPYTDYYAKDALAEYIKGFNIDCVITILDCWDPKAWEIPDIVHKFNCGSIPIIAHVTARSTPQSSWWSAYLIKCDYIIAPSLFGLGTVIEIEDFKNRAACIPHGVDLNIFNPDKGTREKIRKRLGYEDKFVFLAVGRNKGIQKRWDILFKAYKIFLTNTPEAKGKTVLHVHANPHEPNAIDLEQMRNMGFIDIGNEHIVFSTVRPKENGTELEICHRDDPNAMLLNPNWGLNELEMAGLYNAADCHVLTSEGESFCLPVLESQACGVPQIFPAHTTGPELIEKPASGVLTEIITEETTPTMTDVAITSPLAVAKAMREMFLKKKLREECSRNAIENAKHYEWKKIVEKWLFIIERVAEPKLNYKTGCMGF